MQGGMMRYVGGVLLALAVTAIPCGALVVGVAFAPAVSSALHGRALRGPRPLQESPHRRGDRSSAPWNLRMSCPLEASTSQTHDRRKAVRDLICRFSVLSSLQHALVSAAWAEADYNTMRAAKKKYAPRLTKGVTFYEGPLRQAIDAKDWDTVGEAVSENGAAWNLGHIDTFTQGVVGGVVELKGPLKIFASSITASDSETIATQKLYAYASKFVDFNTRLKAAAASGDAQAALSAWKGGCVALRLYHDEINKAIPRSVGKWELQEPPYGRIEVKGLGLDDMALTGRKKSLYDF